MVARQHTNTTLSLLHPTPFLLAFAPAALLAKWNVVYAMSGSVVKQFFSHNPEHEEEFPRKCKITEIVEKILKILKRQSRHCLFATQSAAVFISLSLSHINKISKFLQHFFFVKDLVIQLPLYKARQKLSNKLSCSFTSGIKEGSSRITSWNYRTFGSGCGSIRYILLTEIIGELKMKYGIERYWDDTASCSDQQIRSRPQSAPVGSRIVGWIVGWLDAGLESSYQY